jgi:hypothetical protein
MNTRKLAGLCLLLMVGSNAMAEGPGEPAPFPPGWPELFRCWNSPFPCPIPLPPGAVLPTPALLADTVVTRVEHGAVSQLASEPWQV